MKVSRFIVIVLAVVLCTAGVAVAQTVVDSQVKSGTVVGKTDHSVIIRLEDGTTKEFEVPPGKTAMVDGKEVGLADLKIGTVLSATVHTIATPVDVKTTTLREGEVVKVAGANLTYKEDNKIKNVIVPKGYKFLVNGQETGIEGLTPGMKLNATVITTSTKMTTSTKRGAVSGVAPTPVPAPAVAAAPAPAPAPAPEPAPVAAAPAKKKLPKTAGPLPLLALSGLASLVAGAGLRLRRTR